MENEGTLSIALLSGTDDKLSAAALLTAGAAALGRKVDILLQRCWRSWSPAPPPRQLQRLLDAAAAGQPLHLYLLP